jgi:hypothetical protein
MLPGDHAYDVLIQFQYQPHPPDAFIMKAGVP